MAVASIPLRPANHTPHSVPAATTTTTMSLLGLCPELRLEIYTYLIVAEDVYSRLHRHSCAFKETAEQKTIPPFRTASLPPLIDSNTQEQALRARGEVALYDSEKVVQCRRNCHDRRSLAILGVCKAVRNEALAFFVQLNTFAIQDVQDLLALSRDVPLDHLRRSVKSLTFLEDLQIDTFPVAKYSNIVDALSRLRTIQTIDLPASLAGRDGVLALGGLFCPSLQKVTITALADVHVACDPKDDTDKAKTVTLYLKFKFSFDMPLCSQLGHNTWSKQQQQQQQPHSATTNGVRMCPHCAAYFENIQREVAKWYDFAWHNEANPSKTPKDIVGRAAEIMQQILDAEVPAQPVDMDYAMTADVSVYFPEVKEVKALVLGLPHLSLEARTVTLEKEKGFLEGVGLEDIACCLDEDEKDCTCDCH